MARHDSGWFSAWVHQHLGLCLTIARGLSVEQMLAGFGIAGRAGVAETFESASLDPRWPKVQIGRSAGWTYAVEHLTTRGSAAETLERLSLGSGVASAVAFTQTISVWQYAQDGVLVSGCDLSVPHVRYGSAPHRFDAAMRQAGAFHPGVDPVELGARLLELTCGFVIERQLLEQALASFELT